MRGRMMATAAKPSGALSGAMVRVRCPGDAKVAIAIPSAKQAQGEAPLVIRNGEFARVCVQALHRVESNSYSKRNERAKAAMHTRAQRDPFVRGFRLSKRRHRERERQENATQFDHA